MDPVAAQRFEEILSDPEEISHGVDVFTQSLNRIRVQALDRDGKLFEMDVDGLLAVCIQHEIDHLDGKLFVDYLSALKRTRIRKKLEKEQRQTVATAGSSAEHRVI
jgi:peptide deformylase